MDHEVGQSKVDEGTPAGDGQGTVQPSQKRFMPEDLINAPGAIRPLEGWFHRSKASNDIGFSGSADTTGW